MVSAIKRRFLQAWTENSRSGTTLMHYISMNIILKHKKIVYIYVSMCRYAHVGKFKEGGGRCKILTRIRPGRM
jgi:hypothetical protein